MQLFHIVAPILLGLLLGLTYCTAQGVTNAEAFSTDCETHDDCAPIPNSVCANKKCACDTDNKYTKFGNKCLLDARLNHPCKAGTSVCTVPNSQCTRSPILQERVKRCKCKERYITVGQGNDAICARVITTQDDIRCGPCVENDGKCYGIGEERNYTKAGCICPISRTGPDCHKIHVNVTCEVQSQSKLICYDPHEGMNFSDPFNGAKLHAYGYGNNEICKGHRLSDVSNDPYCGQGMIKLNLSLHDSPCGTQMTESLNGLRYSTRITVTSGGAIGGESVSLNTFCVFQTRASASTDGLNTMGIPGNDRGMEIEPQILFSTTNRLGDEVRNGLALRLGDEMKLRITLTQDGTYSAIRVDDCLISNKAQNSDPKAIAEWIIEDGCPAPGQYVINGKNIFRPVRGRIHEQQTDFVKAVRLREGNSVWFHCSLSLCLKGSESDCLPRNQTTCLSTESSRRRKRAAGSVAHAQVSKEIIYYDPHANEGMVGLSNVAFGALMAVLCVLLLVFIVATVLLTRRVSRQVNRIDDHIPTTKPQRFALPRMARTTQRI